MNFDKFIVHKIHSSRPRAMMDKLKNSINLEMLLEYELKASSRYRRYVSLVMLKGVQNGSSHIKELLSDCIRSCDASFVYGNYIAVLMGETDERGSAKAISRYRKHLNSKSCNINMASVTYPQDGRTIEDLHSILWQRIEEPGAVVGA